MCIIKLGDYLQADEDLVSHGFPTTLAVIWLSLRIALASPRSACHVWSRVLCLALLPCRQWGAVLQASELRSALLSVGSSAAGQ